MKSRLIVFGEVANRERKHLGEGAPGRIAKGGIWDKRRPGTRVKDRPSIPRPTIPRRKVARAFLGRLTLEPGPVRAIELGRLARLREPRSGPWYPHHILLCFCKYLICMLIPLFYLLSLTSVPLYFNSIDLNIFF